MTHIQQHTQISESYTAQSPEQLEDTPVCCSMLPAAPQPGTFAFCSRARWPGCGEREIWAGGDNVPFSCWLAATWLGFSTNWHCSSWGSCSGKKGPWSCLGQAQCFDPWGIASRMWLILIPKGYSCPVQREIVIISVGLTGDLQKSICLGGKADFACWPAALCR